MAILGVIGWIFVVVGALVVLLGVLGVLPAGGGGRGFPAWGGGVSLIVLGVILLVVNYAFAAAPV